ncbi:hypothetical protein [Actinomadura madurae]|nr:hypothetical protein [Actinomadura madurae]MCP9947299.1 hypothetical protein [Actinomadura madurae]MCP9976534.1 hypothetical protein [Actinomadura madurae]MCQ0011968.1 hypothetical protein [Actinomadura madurae]
MAYVARIMREDGSVEEQEVETMQQGHQWIAANKKPGDQASSVWKK